MNTRQKAKYYKRKYEMLLKRYKIDTLRVERFYPDALIVQENSDYLREIVVKDIAQRLASSLDKYIDYRTEFCPHINHYRFLGEIKVVDRL